MLPEAPALDAMLPERRRIKGYPGRRVPHPRRRRRRAPSRAAAGTARARSVSSSKAPGTGKGGLAAAERNAPDLALLDLNMPGLDGWALTRRLQAAHPTLPVIIVSANADEQAKAHDLDRVGFVTKPFEINQLLAAIQSALGLDWIYEENEPAERFHASTANHSWSNRSRPGFPWCISTTCTGSARSAMCAASRSSSTR